MKLSFKGWQFLLISGVILLAVLAFSASYEARQAEIQDLKTEKDLQLQQLQDLKEQLNEAAERLEELETMLLNLQRMEEIVGRAAMSFRGGRPDATMSATTMPVTMPSGFSAARFERVFAGTLLEGIGEALVQAEKATGINALVLAGICALESGWGRSRIAKEKNNLASLGAYDHSPGSAIRFENREECVMFLAELLRDRPGESLEEIGWWYASDPRWAEKVAGCMRAIVERAAL